MNRDTYSAECAHGFHSACDFDDCACECHVADRANESQEAFPFVPADPKQMTIEEVYGSITIK